MLTTILNIIIGILSSIGALVVAYIGAHLYTGSRARNYRQRTFGDDNIESL